MRLALTIITLCIAVTLSKAQDVKIGIRAGTGLAWLNSSERNVLEPDGVRANFEFGVVGEYLFSDNYAFTAGVGLGFGQGGIVNFSEPTVIVDETDLNGDNLPGRGQLFPSDTRVTYKINSVEIPVSLKLRTNELGLFTYFAELPIIQFDIRTNARGDFEGPGFSSEDENITDELVLANVRWGAGAGVEYNISDETFLTAGFYFTSGFIDTHEIPGSKLSPRRLNLRVGILF